MSGLEELGKEGVVLQKRPFTGKPTLRVASLILGLFKTKLSLFVSFGCHRISSSPSHA